MGREVELRKQTEEAWEEAKLARNVKAAFELKRGGTQPLMQGKVTTTSSAQGTKRTTSEANLTPPSRGKCPPMKPIPPNQAGSWTQNSTSRSMVVAQPQGQTSGRSQTGGTRGWQAATQYQQPPPTSAAAGVQPGAGYYHQQYHNGVPVNNSYTSQPLYQGQW